MVSVFFDLLELQVHAKLFADKLIPDWKNDVEAYKQACTVIATIIAYYSPAPYREIIKNFLIDIRKTNDKKEIIGICYDYWRKTDGLYDLCP